MLDAKLVLTMTLTCTEALPTIAGAIRSKILRSPGCEKLMRGRKTKPERIKLGTCQINCQAPPSTTP